MREKDRQTETEKQTDTHRDRQTDRHTERQIERKTPTENFHFTRILVSIQSNPFYS